MGRKPRVHIPGAFYHLVVRGNNRQPIFLSRDDREHFEELLLKGVERFGHLYHAFCMMTNHVHLAAEVSQVPLSHIAHNFLFRYARWFHRKYGRSGHLFERRFGAYRVESDKSLLSLVRYIHLNPVRAGLSDKAASYGWSSHLDYLGEADRGWLTTDFVLSLFSSSPSAARKAYRSFMVAGDREEGAEPEDGGDQPATSPPWASRQSAVAPLPTEPLLRILATVCGAMNVTRCELEANSQQRHITMARAVTAWLVRRHAALTLEDLALALGRDASTLSRAASTLVKKSSEDPGLRELLRTIETKLVAD